MSRPLSLQVGHTYLTEGGAKVRIICTDRKGWAHPCIGLVDHGDDEYEMTYKLNGKAATTWRDQNIVREVPSGATVEGKEEK